jgi:transcription antitermination protein NusB
LVRVLPSTRREARERALGLLYEAESKGVEPAAVLGDLPVPPDPFVADLVGGVQKEQARIDDLIAAHAIDWTIDRMPVVDRALLRMATYELVARPDVPTGAVISEAVELATQYSTEDSGRFVNGVLATIAAVVRPLPSTP